MTMRFWKRDIQLLNNIHPIFEAKKGLTYQCKEIGSENATTFSIDNYKVI